VNAARTANESVPSTISGPFEAVVSESDKTKGWWALATPLPRVKPTVEPIIKSARAPASDLRMRKDYLSKVTCAFWLRI
jgi:hypothetical protein